MKNKNSFKSDLIILLSKYKIGEYCRESDSKLAKDIVGLLEDISKLPMKWDTTNN